MKSIIIFLALFLSLLAVEAKPTVDQDVELKVEVDTCEVEGEEYLSCGTACPVTCTETPRFCTYQCVSGCFCKAGLLRNQAGQCVTKELC